MIYHGLPTFGVPLYGIPLYSIPMSDGGGGGGGGSDGGPAGPARMTLGVYWSSPYTGLSMGVY